jgi:hypothetical protein
MHSDIAAGPVRALMIPLAAAPLHFPQWGVIQALERPGGAYWPRSGAGLAGQTSTLPQ